LKIPVYYETIKDDWGTRQIPAYVDFPENSQQNTERI
jgi:hypothetical protein